LRFIAILSAVENKMLLLLSITEAQKAETKSKA